MKNQKLKIAFVLSLSVGILWTGVASRPTPKVQENLGKKLDTVRVQPLDTVVSVKGKKSLFIGDSHTANHYYGWQLLLCNKTGMQMLNTAVGGKNTYWMLNQAVYSVNKSFDYCFIYGGANDMYSSTSMFDALRNIRGIIKICKGNGVQPIVLTGFDPQLCVRKDKYPIYVSRYTKFQKMLQDSIQDTRVIKTHFVSRSDGDCGDYICHMTASGHKKMAEGIIKEMKFKTIR